MSDKGFLDRHRRNGADGIGQDAIQYDHRLQGSNKHEFSLYVPGCFADTAELVALARVVARHGGIYASHIRDEGAGLLEAIDEALAVGREAGLPVQVSHLKASGQASGQAGMTGTPMFATPYLPARIPGARRPRRGNGPAVTPVARTW